MRREPMFAWLAPAAASLTAIPATAQPAPPVEVELVLAVDVSWSMDQDDLN